MCYRAWSLLLGKKRLHEKTIFKLNTIMILNKMLRTHKASDVYIFKYVRNPYSKAIHIICYQQF